MTSIHMFPRLTGSTDVVFTLNDAESFWSGPALHRSGSPLTWVHGVWSVSGLPRHLYIQKVYLTRSIPLRYRKRFPFIEFRERVRATAPPCGRQRRADGAIEADFFLPDAPTRN